MSAEPRATHWWHRLSSYSIVLIILEVAGLALLVGLTSAFLKAVGVVDEKDVWPPFIYVPVMLFGYAALVGRLERRPVAELKRSKCAREIGLGYLLGAALLTIVVGILALLGVYSVAKTNPPIVMLAPFFWMIMHAVLEELLFRGLIFRLTERSLGSLIALTISSALFGIAHLMNPGATWFGALAICIEAGFLLGAAYMLTRRLWFCIGLHAAWNFVEGSVFSSPVSGFDSVGLLAGRFTGPELLTGGTFGVENSIVTIVLCFLVAVVLFIRARQLGHVIAPFWQRRRDHQSVPSGSAP